METRKVTNSQEIRTLRSALSLTSCQRSVLIGSLLGDGSLSCDGWSREYRFQISQGNNQKDYLFWKFQALNDCCVSEPSYQERNHSWRMRTMSHAEFTAYARQFYSMGKKILPITIEDQLTPLSVAVWFMDDGSRLRDDGYILNTQNFTYQENDRLCLYLERKFSIREVSIHADKKWWRLYVRKPSMVPFRKLIEPYVIDSMRYKLHTFDPVETTRRLPKTFFWDEDIVRAVSKDADDHEQGTRSGSCAWIN